MVRKTLCRASQQGTLSARDITHIEEATTLAGSAIGITQPHPNAACVLVDDTGATLSHAYLLAHGTTSPEVQAVQEAGDAAAGCTAYMNLEPGDCHGDASAVSALIDAGVARVVLGMLHPLPHSRGVAVAALRAAGVHVDVLGEADVACEPDRVTAAAGACHAMNAPLLHRAVLRRPMSVLKYAMTLDGKIASSTGHAAWVSDPLSRSEVFEQRARSDCVIVGGQTVRRDNPRLTTRRETGHQPIRVVMSRTLDLPADANLWDVSQAHTIVMTQRGARRAFQQELRARGVEVVEFAFLNPDRVAAYCYDRGFLQCFWECGGTLAAPAIAAGTIHKVVAFVAPKIIGGTRAPTPVGDLGFVEMTQAVHLIDHEWVGCGPDIMVTGYLPASGGLPALAAAAGGGTTAQETSSSEEEPTTSGRAGEGSRSPSSSAASSSTDRSRTGMRGAQVAEFYKAWDRWGALSNFSPHPIDVSDALGEGSWLSVEHFYQSRKFAGSDDPVRLALIDDIQGAASPEQAAAIGRYAERNQPHLVREGWAELKVDVMLAALRAKYAQHAGPRAMLLRTAEWPVGEEGGGAEGAPRPTTTLDLVEGSPHDFFWGRGLDGSGQNMLGRLLMRVRSEWPTDS